jgi:hypothetical protein
MDRSGVRMRVRPPGPPDPLECALTNLLHSFGRNRQEQKSIRPRVSNESLSEPVTESAVIL